MKLVVNSAYGYLAAGGGLTRFADVHAANEVTRRGREVLDLMCRELARARRDAARGRHRRRLLRRARGVDRGRRAARRRRGRRAAAAARAARVRRALRARCCRTSRRTTRCSATTARWCCAASRSARAAPSRSARRSCAARSRACSSGDVAGVREAYVATVAALRRRELPTYDVSSRVRLTKTPARVPRDARAAARADLRGAARERPDDVDASASACASTAPQAAAAALVPDPDDDDGARRARATRATTTSSTTCACCATPSPRGSRARSRRRTSPRCSPIPTSRRCSRRSLAGARPILTPTADGYLTS